MCGCQAFLGTARSHPVIDTAHLKDLDANDTIDSRDNLLNLITFNVGDGGLKIDNLADIGTQLNNEDNRKNMNNLIQNVSSGLNSAGNVIDLLGPILAQNGDTSGKDSAGLQDKVSQNMKGVIDSMGSAITFYQFGDGIEGIPDKFGSDWVVLQRRDLSETKPYTGLRPLPKLLDMNKWRQPPRDPGPVWTDRYSNLLRVIYWRQQSDD